jgi:hypothetical protein
MAPGVVLLLVEVGQLVVASCPPSSIFTREEEENFAGGTLLLLPQLGINNEWKLEFNVFENLIYVGNS